MRAGLQCVMKIKSLHIRVDIWEYYPWQYKFENLLQNVTLNATTLKSNLKIHNLTSLPTQCLSL